MKFNSFLAAAAFAGIATFGTHQASAAPVDLALTLVVDVSGSVVLSEYNLQMDGYANAFRDPTIQANLLGGANGKSAVNVVFFESNFFTTSLDAFTVLDSADDINAFADILDTFARPGSGGTAIYTGTNRAIDLLLAATSANGALSGTTNLVIDVSGDGTSNTNQDQAARDRAAANNITINGLPIGGTTITNYYTNNVITADGFVQAAVGFEDFAAAVREKLKIETGTTNPNPVPLPGTLVLAALAIGLLQVKRKAA